MPYRYVSRFRDVWAKSGPRPTTTPIPKSPSRVPDLLHREPLEPVTPVSLVGRRSFRPPALTASRLATFSAVLGGTACREREAISADTAADGDGDSPSLSDRARRGPPFARGLRPGSCEWSRPSRCARSPADRAVSRDRVRRSSDGGVEHRHGPQLRRKCNPSRGRWPRSCARPRVPGGGEDLGSRCATLRMLGTSAEGSPRASTGVRECCRRSPAMRAEVEACRAGGGPRVGPPSSPWRPTNLARRLKV
jgi:hypothetical protein